MIAYNNRKLPYGLEYVGDGWTVRKTAHCTGKDTLQFMEGLCKHLIAHPDPMVVPVYSFVSTMVSSSPNIYEYQYEMMRLGDLTREEAGIIWQVGDAWRIADVLSIEDPTRQFKDDAPYSVEECWDKHPKLMKFLKQIVVLDRYHDLHGENIMLDNDGDYRIIDLEGFQNSPLSRPSNSWITKPCQAQPATEFQLVV